MSENPQYQQKFRIHTYEVDLTGRVSVISLQKYMQEAAVEHAIRLKASMYELYPKNLTWVLYQMFIRVYFYPRLHEEITVHTWPSGRNRFFAYRDFEIRDANENVVAHGISTWSMIQLTTKRPVPLPEFILQIPYTPRRVLEKEFQKIHALKDAAPQKRFFVRLSDLDMNKHVNNTAYLDWCLEAIPVQFWDEHILTELEIHFRSESLYGDVIQSSCLQQDSQALTHFHHGLVRESDGRELARALSRWKPKHTSEE